MVALLPLGTSALSGATFVLAVCANDSSAKGPHVDGLRRGP